MVADMEPFSRNSTISESLKEHMNMSSNDSGGDHETMLQKVQNQ